MKNLFPSLPARWPLLLSSLLLLSACTPSLTTRELSPSLQQQLARLQQQQSEQAQLIKILQQQILQPQATETTQRPSASAIATGKPLPITIPAEVTREINALTDSAASYLAAFSELAAGHYAAAEAGFSSFSNKYPQHQYAPNARYWLASAQLPQGKLAAAASNLRQIITDSKGQQRAPAALAMLAKIYRQQRLDDDADDVLEQLRSRYPESSEAQQIYRSDDPQY